MKLHDSAKLITSELKLTEGKFNEALKMKQALADLHHNIHIVFWETLALFALLIIAGVLMWLFLK